MDQKLNLLCFHKPRKQEKDGSNYFHRNGALVMKDLIATFGPRYNLPIRSFSPEELIRATKNFSEQVSYHDLGTFYRGSLEDRPVLVKCCWKTNYNLSYFIRDIVITSQMSHHKNVLPLIGCCLELEIPAMVYDNALDHQFLGEMFDLSSKANSGKVISWRNRIKIAKDVSSVLIYLHRAFLTPIIFRDLKVMRVVIDRCGVAKLVGFALSISLPPGEVRVEDHLVGTWGYIDPEYVQSSFVTEKSDVYNMGVLVLALFYGQSSAMVKCAEERRKRYVEDNTAGVDDGEMRTPILIQHYTKDCIENSLRFQQFLDPKIFEEDGQNEPQILEHLRALSTLALKCTESRGDDRPKMIDVAKQLSQMEKCVRS